MSISPALLEAMALPVRAMVAVMSAPSPLYLSMDQAMIISVEAISAAARAGWVMVPKSDVIEAAERIESTLSGTKCWFDHHGGCQEHGYLSLEPGEICPEASAVPFTARLRAAAGEAT